MKIFLIFFAIAPFIQQISASNVCTCENGTPHTGNQCHFLNGNSCLNCNAGYVREGLGNGEPCILTVPVCMDSRYVEYNPDVQWNYYHYDESCVTMLGCMDSDYDEYNPDAQVDDGSCVTISGCMVPLMKNYDALANANQGCQDWDEGIYSTICSPWGCLNPLYAEYDSTHKIHNQTACKTLLTHTDAQQEFAMEKTMSLVNYQQLSLSDKKMRAKAARQADKEIWNLSDLKVTLEEIKVAKINTIRSSANLEVGNTIERNVNKVLFLKEIFEEARKDRVSHKRRRQNQREQDKKEASVYGKTAFWDDEVWTDKEKAEEARENVKESRVDFQKTDLPDIYTAYFKDAVKDKVEYVSAEDNSGDSDKCAETGEPLSGVADCCTYDFSEDGNSTVLVGIDRVGAWAVLCDGNKIVSKQTRTTEANADGVATYNMSCFVDNEWTTPINKQTGTTMPCGTHYTILIGSIGGIDNMFVSPTCDYLNNYWGELNCGCGVVSDKCKQIRTIWKNNCNDMCPA